MAFGFGVLRHSPSTFWALTPRELQAALEGLYGRRESAPSRDILARLMSAFPDARDLP